MLTTTTMRTILFTLCGLVAGLGACASSGGDDGVGDDDMPPEPIDEKALIDDCEDDGVIAEVDGRIGAWFTYNDDEGKGMNLSQMPPTNGDFAPFPGGFDGSMGYCGTTGEKYNLWGAGMGFDFNNTGMGGPKNEGEKKPWDASAYVGVRFMAKGNVTIRIGIQTVATIDAMEGGTCVPAGPKDDDPGCGDGFGKSITLTGEWKEYKIPFDATIKQEGWGVKATFDVKTITGINFDAPMMLKFDVGLDNLAFYK